jgi:hypothetical protein
MKKLLLKAGMAVLGVVVTLLWWTYHEKGSSAQSVSHIPSKVAAGGNQLEIVAEASTPSTMRVLFEDLSKPAGQQILIESWEKIPAGPHSWTVDVPAGIGGSIELNADHPHAGDTLSTRVKVNGKEIDQQTDKLERPLEPNTAFFVQFHYDDFSKASAGDSGGDRE